MKSFPQAIAIDLRQAVVSCVAILVLTSVRNSLSQIPIPGLHNLSSVGRSEIAWSNFTPDSASIVTPFSITSYTLSEVTSHISEIAYHLLILET